MTELFLVRHGQTESNVKKHLQGQSDGALTAKGRQQAKKIADILRERKIDHVLTSPMIRAKDTAEEIAKLHNLQVIENPILKEWHVGNLDGLPADALFKAREKAGLPIPEFRPEGGETLIEVQARARQFLNEVNSTYADFSLVVCSHGDFLRMLISVLEDISILEANDIHLDNATYSLFTRQGDQWRCEGINLTV